MIRNNQVKLATASASTSTVRWSVRRRRARASAACSAASPGASLWRRAPTPHSPGEHLLLLFYYYSRAIGELFA